MKVIEQRIGLEHFVAGSESAGDQLVLLLPAVSDNNHVAMPQDVQEEQNQGDGENGFEDHCYLPSFDLLKFWIWV